jgi:hypothetical protein
MEEVLNGVDPAKETTPTTNGVKEEKKDIVTKAIGLGLSVAVLFATVWVVGRAWKQSQKA